MPSIDALARHPAEAASGIRARSAQRPKGRSSRLRRRLRRCKLEGGPDHAGNVVVIPRQPAATVRSRSRDPAELGEERVPHLGREVPAERVAVLGERLAVVLDHRGREHAIDEVLRASTGADATGIREPRGTRERVVREGRRPTPPLVVRGLVHP